MKSKVNTITTIVFGLIIFALAKYYTKEYKKQTIKEPVVETIIIDKKNKPILIPSAQSINSAVEQMAFSATDIVWLGYHDHYAMSGVLVLAGKSKKVTIATNDGLIGWHTRQKRLGLTVNIKNNFHFH